MNINNKFLQKLEERKKTQAYKLEHNITYNIEVDLSKDFEEVQTTYKELTTNKFRVNCLINNEEKVILLTENVFLLIVEEHLKLNDDANSIFKGTICLNKTTDEEGKDKYMWSIVPGVIN